VAKQRAIRDVDAIIGRPGKPDLVVSAGQIIEDTETGGAKAKALKPTHFTPAP
jgi:hypothetical protein